MPDIAERPLRNVAIIAHVDHGKTTLVDFLLRQSGVFRANQQVEDCVMDSNAIEKERGITILAKNTSVLYKGIKINIIDTPGHADFGGEVERVLWMADGCLLLVDAAEGPKPQTRFVLKKALGYGLRPIVVINKMDRPDARPAEVLNEIFDLFCELDAHDAQLDFPVVYAVGREGWSKLTLDEEWKNFVPLFEKILSHVPAPKGDPDAPVQLQVANIDHSDYVGRLAIGRLMNGTIRKGSPVTLHKHGGGRETASVTELLTFTDLRREKVESASAGDIVCLAGLDTVGIGDTVATGDAPPLPSVKIDEPTLQMVFAVNDSPLAGKEGKFVTSRHLKERLEKELRVNVALRVEETDVPNAWRVSGRGILHLGILIENMRREGYELQIGKPEIILHEEKGKILEPVELVTVDAPERFAGKVIEIFGSRRGTVEKMENRRGWVYFQISCPARGLLGVQGKLMNATQGEATMYHAFQGYEPWRGDIPGRAAGVMVSMSAGAITNYALFTLQDRGYFFVVPGQNVYDGQIVGEHCKDLDIIVHPCRTKKLTNMRAAAADATIILAPPRLLGLEEALEFINEEEMVEVTPQSIRLRKRELDARRRRRTGREAEQLVEEA